MKFNAKALLEKHGWEKGQGLGKEGQGMKEAIRVKMKPNTNGLGYSVGEQYTYNWWDHAYNQAAKSLTVSTSHDGSIRIETCPNAVAIGVKKKGKKKSSEKNSNQTKYNYFIQSATLTDDVTVCNADKEDGMNSEEENDEGTISKLSSEELFEACGRMTAHKGARHGLNLKGKLTRVQAQERLFLEKYKKEETTNKKNTEHTSEEIRSNSENNLKVKNKYKKIKSNTEVGEENKVDIEKRKKKKKRKIIDENKNAGTERKQNKESVDDALQETIQSTHCVDVFNEDGSKSGGNKKKKSSKDRLIALPSDTINNKALGCVKVDENMSKKKKKKK